MKYNKLVISGIEERVNFYIKKNMLAQEIPELAIQERDRVKERKERYTRLLKTRLAPKSCDSSF